MKLNIKGSILKRIFIYFILFAVLLFVLCIYFFATSWNSIPLSVFASMLALFILYFLGVYLYEIVRPMESLISEMKALLTGHQYHRIYTKRTDEIGIIAHFFNEVTKSFEKVSGDIKEGKRMMNELEVAANIQKDILPTQNPNIKGLDISAKTRSAAELGGDNFDFLTVNENSFIYVGDVTGHGVPAAIVMTMVHTLIHTLVDFYTNAFDVVVKTNAQLKKRIKSTMFMTMLMLRWNAIEQKMTYVGAGHEHLVIYRAKLGKCEVLPTGGIALGMVPDNSRLIKEKEILLDYEDVIILYTDGITEGRNMNGEMFGLDSLVKSIEKYAAIYDADSIVQHIAVDYSMFTGGHVQDDDVTLIAIKKVSPEDDNNKKACYSTSWEN